MESRKHSDRVFSADMNLAADTLVPLTSAFSGMFPFLVYVYTVKYLQLTNFSSYSGLNVNIQFGYRMIGTIVPPAVTDRKF